ncbi:MAG: PEGA domain-containing protein [Bdellovibrionota bacterium]
MDQVQVSPDGQPIPPKDPFESSNTTIELDQPKKKKMSIDTGKVQPAPHLASNTPSQRVQSKPRPRVPEMPKTQPKSIAIILVLLVIITFAGFYLAKSKPSSEAQQTTAQSDLPAPSIPDPQTMENPSAQDEGTAEGTLETSSMPKAKKSTAPIAFVNVHSSPKGAEVWMNGKKMAGKTPISNLKVSTKQIAVIDIKKSGYTNASKSIELTPQETRTVMFQLAPPKTPVKKKALTPTEAKAAALAKARALSAPKPAPKKKPVKKKP